MELLIDGKRISREIKDELREKMAELKARGEERCLAVIQVGDDPASCVYVRNKKKACEYVGIKSISWEMPAETTEEALLELIGELNGRQDVNGILVQLPLPGHIDEDRVLLAIAPEKDVDGFHPVSVGSLSIGRPGYVSCTPAALKLRGRNVWCLAEAILWANPWPCCCCGRTARLQCAIPGLKISGKSPGGRIFL